MRRQCYWLQELEASPDNPDRFRVCLVTENNPGYQPTGGGDGGDYVAPWYWDQATCVVMNERRFGLTADESARIVLSSMFCGSPAT